MSLTINEEKEESVILDDKGLSDDKLSNKLHSIDRDGIGWTPEVEQTVLQWTNVSNNIEFIYDSVLSLLSGTFQRYNNIALVFSGLSTVIGFLSASDIISPKIITSIASGLSFCAFISMGLAKNKNLTTRIREISTYFASVSDFSGVLESEMQIPVHLRKNAEHLITNLASEYRRLIGNKPHLTQAEKDYASYLWKNYISNNGNSMDLTNSSSMINVGHRRTNTTGVEILCVS